MSGNRVIIVHLRRPKTADPNEMRSDPFWEFGSFGITKCHSTNLMNVKNAYKLEGIHLAFAQGGKQGTRLVHLTPPVKILQHPSCVEAKWLPAEMPFCYCSAPVLMGNKAKSQFPKLAASLKAIKRTTSEGKFSSKFRSAATYLDDELAHELIRIYDERRRKAPDSEIAHSYVDALPCCPPRCDEERERTYAEYLDKARGSKRRHLSGRRKQC